MQERNQYLEIVFALERLGFVNLCSRTTETRDSAHTEQVSLTIPALDSCRSRTLPWYPEFARLVGSGQSQGFLSNVIVHGSYGDFTTTPFSDLDCTVVLRSAVFEKRTIYQRFRRWLNRFYAFLFRIDPLQHHGPFYLWPALSRGYENSILPLAVYVDAWAVEPIETTIHLLRREEHPSQSMDISKSLSLGLCDNLLRSDQLLFRLGYNRFAMKRYLSYVMLIPAFYYTDIGKPGRKADSFLPFRKEFDGAAAIVDIATELRQSWPQTPNWFTPLRVLCGHHKILRRASCLTLRCSRTERVIRNEIQPHVSQLRSALKEHLCLK